jgi:hypothetical protein
VIRKDHSAKNAIKQLYQKKYELDKRHDFRVPKLKTDIEAYLHLLLDSVDEAFDTANVVRYKGHELKWASQIKEDDND